MTPVESSQSVDFDTKLLAEFIYALNITRRQILSYPVGHPIVATATAKLIAIVPRLLEFRTEITLGIARDALLVEESLLDADNPVFQDLARNLFDVRIASLTIRRGLTEDEVLGFFAIFQNPPEALAEAGGIEKVAAAAGFKSISAKEVDFSVFKTTEVAAVHAPERRGPDAGSSLLWKSFVRGIISGSLDPDGVKYVQKDVDPDTLAEILNREYSEKGSSVEKSYEEAITIFLNQGEQSKLRDADYRDTVGRLDEMVASLKPELRRKLLGSTLKRCAQRPNTAETFLKNMPQATLIDALDNINAGSLDIPQTLLDILGKLSVKPGDEVSQSRVFGESGRSVQETSEQLAMLFREDNSQYFVPGDYQDALAAVSVATVDQRLDREPLGELYLSLNGRTIDGQFSAVMIDMLGHGVDQSTLDAIDQNLAEMLDYFLASGDFASLSRIYRLLCPQDSSHYEATRASAPQTLARFASDAFVEGVLDGLDLWGKSVQSSILDLIEDVGSPFAEQLLERLADEASMSRRRLYMACLVRIGPQIKGVVADRLKDSRWFFVRNMVVILRELNDPSVVPLLGRLSDYKHPKVQFEVLKTLLDYEDARANQFLLNALSKRSSEKLMSAVRLAANSDDPQVIKKLAQLLSRRLSGEQEMEVKNNVIKAMEQSATEAVLPDLAKLFFRRRFFASTRYESLKVPAVAILGKIGTLDAGIMAGQIAQSACGELAEAAEKVLAEIHRKLT